MENKEIEDLETNIEIKEEYDDVLEFQSLNNIDNKTYNFDDAKEAPKNETNVFNWKSFKWVCYFCTCNRSNYKALRKHLQTVHHIGINAKIFYKHEECMKVSNEYAHFLNHMKTAHYAQLQLCCDVCNEKNFSDYASFATHRESHATNSWYPITYPCQQCEMIFSLNIEREKHLKTFHGDRSQQRKCPICHMWIQIGAKFYMHLKTHTSFASNDAPSTSKNSAPTSSIPNSCSTIAHTNELAANEDSLNSFICEVCELRVESADLLATHKKVHTYDFKHSNGKELFHEIVLLHKTKIINENEIKNATDPCWVELSVFTGQYKTPYEIYQYIKQNVSFIKTKLLKSNNENNPTSAKAEKKHISDSALRFIVRIATNDFNVLLERHSIVAGQQETFQLIPDLWENFFEEIRNERSLNCIYKFTNNYVNSKSGFITGSCKCGCKIDICIMEEPYNIIALRCAISKSQKKKEKYQCNICFVNLETLEMFEQHKKFHINSVTNEVENEITTCYMDVSNHQENSSSLSNELLNESILKFKSKIVYKDDGVFKIAQSSNTVWLELSKAVNKIKTPLALHAYVTSNENGIRNLLEKSYQNDSDEIFNEISLTNNEAENIEQNITEDENELLLEPIDIANETSQVQMKNNAGCKPKTNYLLLNKTILKFKNKITFYEQGIMKINSKLHPAWLELSKATGRIKTPQALYAYVSNNTQKIRDLLEAEENDEDTTEIEMDHKRDTNCKKEIDPEKLNKIILQFKENITFMESKNLKIKSKLDPCWKALSMNIEEIKTPAALYTYVINNSHNIRYLLEFENQKPKSDQTMSDDILGSTFLSNQNLYWERIILRFKEKLTYLEDGVLKLKEKSDIVWTELSQALPIPKTSLAVYLHVFNNKKLRDLLKITLPEPSDKYFNDRSTYYKIMLQEKISEYKDKITFEEDGILKFKNETDSIWQEISNLIENMKTSKEIYNFAVNSSSANVTKTPPARTTTARTSNRFKKDENIKMKTENIPPENDPLENDPLENTPLENNPTKEIYTRFVILVEKKEFTNLFQERTISQRKFIKMKPGLWSYFLTTKIYETQRQTCGYNFKSHYISPDLNFGKIKGYCRCGSQLRCYIHKKIGDHGNDDDELYEIYCQTTKGEEGKRCKKVYIRNPVRQHIATQLMNSSVSEFQKKATKELQIDNKNDEPGCLMHSRTLYTIKSEFKNKSVHQGSRKHENIKRTNEKQNCEQTLPRRRGKPPKYTAEQLNEIFFPFKNKLTYERDGEIKLKSLNDPIWTELARSNECVPNPKSLHVLACKYRNLRSMLNLSETKFASDDNCSSNSESEEGKETLNFAIRVPYEEFSKLITTSKGCREKNILKPGLWTHFLNTKIWESQRQKCGFQFKGHYLEKNGKTGRASGYCKCGAKLNCLILEDKHDSTITVIHCKIIKGDENKSCGKVYLRNPIRQQIGEQLQQHSVEEYRKEQSSKLMETDDNIESPLLFNASTLMNVKCEYGKRKFDGDDSTSKKVKRKRIKKEATLDEVDKKCLICDLNFETSELLEEHNKTHSISESNDNSNDYIPVKRGRKPKCDYLFLQEQILNFKYQICYRDEGKLKFKTGKDPIWIEISKAINEIRPANSLYAYVMKNERGIRDLIKKAWCSVPETLSKDQISETTTGNCNSEDLPGSSNLKSAASTTFSNSNNFQISSSELNTVDKTNEDFLIDMLLPTENQILTC